MRDGTRGIGRTIGQVEALIGPGRKPLRPHRSDPQGEVAAEDPLLGLIHDALEQRIDPANLRMYSLQLSANGTGISSTPDPSSQSPGHRLPLA